MNASRERGSRYLMSIVKRKIFAWLGKFFTSSFIFIVNAKSCARNELAL